jgi:hypothetical protein
VGDDKPAPVICSPGGQIIGKARTVRGAIRCARNIPKLPCERWTASRGTTLGRLDLPDGTPVWRAGPQLVTRTARTAGNQGPARGGS